jgi:hypothetical protein
MPFLRKQQVTPGHIILTETDQFLLHLFYVLMVKCRSSKYYFDVVFDYTLRV